MGRRGRKRQLDVETEYWRLLATGIGTVEACKAVGIGRKTGYRWRAESGGLAPARVAETGRTGRFLSRLERQRIATLRRDGLGVRAIAALIGRAPSTVSRELRRNMRRHDNGVYDGDLAHARSRQHALRPRRTRLGADPGLRAVVQAKLELEWSPAQIAAHLRRDYPARPAWHLCHETIYQGLYHGGKAGLSRALTTRLRTRRPLRKRRRRGGARRGVRFIAPARLIEHRPVQVESRSRVGDWEGDLIVGRLSQSAIGTLVERRSRLVRLVHLPHGHSATACRAALHALFATVPAGARMTLTWDQGAEMAYHDTLASLFAEGIFFAHPASPWQRGSNENTNGLLRQYFPKKTDLNAYGIEALADAEHRLNHRPRKGLDWRTPAEVFTAALR